ncbi:MAG: SDR family NAD(P)-dependent oxidoreductase [Candidatus Alcyoniella australis]|nr:SDR family NAD(P)-dependent oxidoreductase [Candidatus Alcyoniella australis]
MSKALVTGGAGFIGSHMAQRLLDLDWDVTVIDNESTGNPANVPKGVRYIKGDVRNRRELAAAFDQPLDLVVHIAGQASTIRSFLDPADDLSVNVNGAIEVMQAVVEHRVPRVLYASSMTAYGLPQRLPVTEDDPTLPVSYYGITKLAAERYLLATGMRSDLDAPPNVTAFRMFNVYGPRQSLSNPYQGVLAIFINAALRGLPIVIHSDGEQSRDFIFIDDVVNAWIAAIDKPASYGQVFNLGSGTLLTVNRLVDSVLADLGKTREDYEVRYEPVRPGDQRHMQAKIAKAAQLLDWQPQVTFEQGLQRTIQWAKTEEES